MRYFVAQGKVNKGVLYVSSACNINIILEVFKKINLKIQGKNAFLCLKSVTGMKLMEISHQLSHMKMLHACLRYPGFCIQTPLL